MGVILASGLIGDNEGPDYRGHEPFENGGELLLAILKG